MSSSDHSKHELISGYLDDALTPDESVVVEEMLRTDAEARQLRDELQSASKLLGDTPILSLGADFHTRVLQAANAELIAERGALYGDEPQPAASRTRKLPTWVGPLVAVAATMAIAVGLALLSAPKDNSPHIAESNGGGPDLPNMIGVSTPGTEIPVTQDNDIPVVTEREYLLVIDLLITEQGMLNKAFDHSLGKHGIAYDTEVTVTDELQAKLLKSRFLQKGVVEAEKGKKPKNPVELVLVVSQGQQFDALWGDLTTAPDEIRGYHFDLTILETDREVVQGLNQASKGRLALAKLPERLLAKYLGRAQRISMKAALDSRRVEDFFTAKSQPGTAQPLPAPNPLGLIPDADENYRVLFVLHTLGEKR